MNTAVLLSRTALEFPSCTAIAVGARSYVTFGDLAARVAALASGLLTLTGARPGDRDHALFASNRPEYVEVMFACWWAGLTAVPINAKLHPKEVQHILCDSEAVAVFTSPKLTGTIDGVVPADVSIVEMGSDAYGAIGRGSACSARALRTGLAGVAVLHQRNGLGYWKNPEATANTFRNGWLYTGDLGRFAENGVLVLAGRSKETIISGGPTSIPSRSRMCCLRIPMWWKRR